MEGESNRREDEESHESRPESLDDYREELAERYRDSDDDGQGKPQRDFREPSENHEDTSATRLDEGTSEAPEAEHGQEQSHLSTKDKEKPGFDVEHRSKSGDDDKEEGNVKDSELGAENRSHTELEEFRDHLKEKYPEGNECENGSYEPDRGSSREGENADSSNLQDYKNDNQEKSETANGATVDAATAEAMSQRSGHDEIPENERIPSLDVDDNSSAATISRPEASRVDMHERNLEAPEERRDGADGAAGSKEGLATEDIACTEIHDPDSRKDLTQVAAPGNPVQAENREKISGPDERDRSEFGRTAGPIQSPVKEDEVATPLDKRDEVAARADTASNTTVEERPSTNQSQMESVPGGKGSQVIQIESRQAVEAPTGRNDYVERSATEDKILENSVVAEKGSDGEAKIGTGKQSRELHATSMERQKLSMDEVVGRHDQPDPKPEKKLTDLESVGADSREDANPERGRLDVQSRPKIPHPGSSRQERLEKVDTIPVNANRRQSNPVVIRFDIPKQAIEEKMGVKIEEDKLYDIKGTVVGKYDFETQRTIKNYVHHFVPVEEHHKIQTGKTYDIRITSITEVSLTPAQRKLVSEWSEKSIPWNRIIHRLNHMPPEQAELNNRTASDLDESEKRTKLHQLEKLERVDNIGAIFTAVSRLQKGDRAYPRDRFYFRIDNSEYKQKTGVAIDEGRTYRISGEIEGVGQFQKKLRSVAAGQDMPIYVPHELKSKVELGKQYKITINSVERVPSIRDSWEKLEKSSSEWTWREITSWIDTEGRINSESGFYADIAQKDKKVIQEICSFYDELGLHPNMILQKSVGCYHAHLHRVDDVATVIKNIEPYIRTENKKEQIQQFKERLSAPRKTVQRGIREARKILDI